MKYRLQKSDHLGVVNRAFGGRVAHWSPWKTIQSYPDLVEATNAFYAKSRYGLSRWRLLLGKEIVLTAS